MNYGSVLGMQFVYFKHFQIFNMMCSTQLKHWKGVWKDREEHGAWHGVPPSHFIRQTRLKRPAPGWRSVARQDKQAHVAFLPGEQCGECRQTHTQAVPGFTANSDKGLLSWTLVP